LRDLSAADLPFIDEHSTEVEAVREHAWGALREVLGRAFGDPRRERLARLLGASETRSRGDPATPGSTIAGFRVARADAPVKLVLEGEHRFSRYALIFHLDPLPGSRCRLRAETRAEFPGLRGRVYRIAVIGSRGHLLVVRRLLNAVRARAERQGLATTHDRRRIG
jgi:hypothetical protein